MKLPLPFDNPSTYPGHSGVDFGKPEGVSIPASGPGVVTAAGYWNKNAGYATIVQYDNGPSVLYCHQPAHAFRPSPGTRVLEGSSIGSVGSTGRSTGPHLHMEIMSGKGAHTYQGIWLHFDKTRTVGQSPNKEEEEEEMPITILEIKNDSQAAKSLYDVKTGKAIRMISKDENTAFRAAQSTGGVVYVSVSKAEYKQRGGF